MHTNVGNNLLHFGRSDARMRCCTSLNVGCFAGIHPAMPQALMEVKKGKEQEEVRTSAFLRECFL